MEPETQVHAIGGNWTRDPSVWGPTLWLLGQTGQGNNLFLKKGPRAHTEFGDKLKGSPNTEFGFSLLPFCILFQQFLFFLIISSICV